MASWIPFLGRADWLWGCYQAAAMFLPIVPANLRVFSLNGFAKMFG